ncbi:flavin-containing monooxygenase [Mycobacterium camsae]|uniref:flavin-containing monooxygenase n=1 Tax=Mycobacterium gordonae TaxID=1778 RepID=UPI001F12220C|nr:NAD(P)/FAD-dependent oxidoreductase [Mycobacterium gordonae]
MSTTKHFEAVVIGAGFSGLRMLWELRQLGLSARVIEAAPDVGGTWYWNRYPGARTDSQSWVYAFSFSKELQDEWDWQERYPTQAEALAYLQYVADRFVMRRDIQFQTRVESAVYDETDQRWTVTTDQGDTYTCKYLVAATGVLSLPYTPPFPGIDTFAGESYVTGRWPQKRVDFAGKRVAVIGTGATAIPLIPIVAQTAAHVMVFQRTPNYVLPARNAPLSDEERQAIRTTTTFGSMRGTGAPNPPTCPHCMRTTATCSTSAPWTCWRASTIPAAEMTTIPCAGPTAPSPTISWACRHTSSR